MIIAVDFDGTLASTKAWPAIGKPRLPHKILLWWIKRRQRMGDTIILHTCREEYINDALLYLNGRGFIPDFVNENDPAQCALFGSDCRKISADRYIDDKNIGLIGFILRRWQ